MNQCLHCKKEYEAKRAHSKFCSTSCRVMYNRKHPAGSLSKVQVQALYNQMMEFMAIGQKQYNGPKLPDNFKADEPVLKPGPVVPKVAADAIMRKYVEDRRDCGSQEEYVSWVEKLETDERLSTRQKELVKNTR